MKYVTVAITQKVCQSGGNKEQMPKMDVIRDQTSVIQLEFQRFGWAIHSDDFFAYFRTPLSDQKVFIIDQFLDRHQKNRRM
jgi:hypothetical protein